MDELVAFLEAADSDEKASAEAQLAWCSASLAAQAGDTPRSDVQAVLLKLDALSLPTDAITRLAGCAMGAWSREGPPESFFNAMKRRFSETVPADARKTWSQACMNWGQLARERGDLRGSLAFLGSAVAVDEENPEARNQIERLRLEQAKRRRRLVTITGVAVAAAGLIVGSFSTYRHFTTAGLTVALPRGLDDGVLRIASATAAGPSIFAGGKSVLHSELKRGRYLLEFTKQYYADWESTVTLPGASQTSVAIPPLALSREGRVLTDWGFVAGGEPVEWEGVAELFRQPFRTFYTAIIRVPHLQGDASGSFEYPSLRCNGSLVLQRNDGNSLEFEIRDVRGPCRAGTVELQRIGQGMIEYLFLTGDGSVAARGLLGPGRPANTVQGHSTSVEGAHLWEADGMRTAEAFIKSLRPPWKVDSWGMLQSEGVEDKGLTAECSLAGYRGYVSPAKRATVRFSFRRGATGEWRLRYVWADVDNGMVASAPDLAVGSVPGNPIQWVRVNSALSGDGVHGRTGGDGQQARARGLQVQAAAEAAGAREEQRRQEQQRLVLELLPGKWDFINPDFAPRGQEGGYLDFQVVGADGSVAGEFVFPEWQYPHNRFQGRVAGTAVVLIRDCTPPGGIKQKWTATLDLNAKKMTGHAEGIVGQNWSASWSAVKH